MGRVANNKVGDFVDIKVETWCFYAVSFYVTDEQVGVDVADVSVAATNIKNQTLLSPWDSVKKRNHCLWERSPQTTPNIFSNLVFNEKTVIQSFISMKQAELRLKTILS